MNDVTQDPPPHAKNQRALVVAALARELAREARGRVWHWDQVASVVVTHDESAPQKGSAAEYLLRAERIRALALGVIELDQDVDARALEAIARDVTEMLDAVARVRSKHIEQQAQSQSASARASSSSASSGSWPAY